MFTRSDLTALMDATPDLGVSIFLPTHVRGAEIRQDPIRLKNLAAEARDKLLAAGLRRAEADGMLAPATALVEDYKFWQRQSHGLAVFLDGARARHHKVPLPLPEKAVVGPGFYVRPLLPVLAADGAFLVLAITADRVRLFEASRFAITEDEGADLPGDLGEVMGESDYENPLQAGPANRPNGTRARGDQGTGVRGHSGRVAQGTAGRVRPSDRRGAASPSGVRSRPGRAGG